MVVDRTKFLTKIIDQQLTMNSHIEYIATNISGTIGVLCRIHLFACQSVLKIYNYHNSLINSYRHYRYIGQTTISQD